MKVWAKKGRGKSVMEVSIAVWWRSLGNYNPPQRALSKRHLAIASGATSTLCGISLPPQRYLLPQPASDLFGAGHSDCVRCARAADLEARLLR